MPSSGSTNFTVTRDEIITRSFKIMGVIEAGESPSAEDIKDGALALNLMIKFWMAAGFKLWKIEEATVFLEPGQTKYSLGTGGDHAAISTVKTELSAAATSGVTSISVDSITDISNGDNIGVILDDGTTHWTTVNGAPTGTTVVLTTGLASAASVDAHVYTYTNILVRPLRLRSARLRNDADSDTPLLEWSRDDYFDTPNKFSQGTPTAVYYDPQLNLGELHVWQGPNTATDRLFIDFDMPLEDFDASSDNADFPQEWFDVLAMGLADRMRLEYGVPKERSDQIHSDAKDMTDLALGFDSEPESTYFTPSLDPE